MCGIVGLIDYSSEFRSREDIEAACIHLKNRGPDFGGSWSDGVASLGHRRLAIIDQREESNQPMVGEGGRYVITFNGEIYNYRELAEELGFSSYVSDTSVLLSSYIKWGVDCLQKLEGMFSFAIWDTIKLELFAARDRCGVKPLYYALTKTGLVFASRPSAIFKLPIELSKDLDPQSIRLLFEVGFIPSPYSIYSNIKKLAPGKYILLRESDFKVLTYWSPSQGYGEEQRTDLPEKEMLDRLDEILTESIERRMQSSVPIGAFLSGGIDSSIVAATMAKISKEPISTFTIGFEDSYFDESQHAYKVAKHLKTRHYERKIGRDNVDQYARQYFKYFDEPICDNSAIPALALAEMAKEHATVILGGEGGDELFSGYWYHQGINQFSKYFRFPHWSRNVVSGILIKLPSTRARYFGCALGQRELSDLMAFFIGGNQQLENILTPEIIESTNSVTTYLSDCFDQNQGKKSALQGALDFDLAYLLPDAYLQRMDIATMAYSIEAREPMLDKTLIEFAISIPLKYKINSNVTKYILRELAYRYIPKKIIDRPKQPFAAPINNWLRSCLLERLQDRFADSKLTSKVPLNWKNLNKTLDHHISGAINAANVLWPALCLLEIVS